MLYLIHLEKQTVLIILRIGFGCAQLYSVCQVCDTMNPDQTAPKIAWVRIVYNIGYMYLRI